MKSFSNTYIFLFSAIMVIIVASLLSFVSIKLKPAQEKNIKVEKVQNILATVEIEGKKKEAENLFKEFFKETYVVDFEGNIIEEEIAFDVDLKEQQDLIEKIKNLSKKLEVKRISPFKKFLSRFINFKEIDREEVLSQINELKKKRRLPVYVCEHENGNTYYVFPVRGKGLWGPIWGYISIESDMNTVFGAVFDHKSETPGLGAEIKESPFESKFKGKKLYTGNNFSAIKVIKSGTATADEHNIDAISGGTITSKGLEAMLYDCLEGYEPFMKNKRK